jgi:hypothetical protein
MLSSMNYMESINNNLVHSSSFNIGFPINNQLNYKNNWAMPQISSNFNNLTNENFLFVVYEF